MKIVLIGKQGSGKGTQAALLSKRFRMQWVYPGNILREISKKKTPIGKRVKAFIDKGKLAPHEITNSLVITRLKKLNSFVLDGFPRHTSQLRALNKSKLPIDKVILLKISDKTAIERLSGRLTCVCGETYHEKYKRPKKDLLCDKCGRKLFKRADDTKQAIEKRIAIFKKESKPVINFYKKKGSLVEASAEGSAEEVFRRILKVLKD